MGKETTPDTGEMEEGSTEPSKKDPSYATMDVEDTIRRMRPPPGEEEGGQEAMPSDPTLAATRRRRRKRQSLDSILGDVLHDALLLRDMGEKPSVDFVYKRTQERLYEEEYGKKPASAKEVAEKFIPFPPDFHLHRLLPLFTDSTTTTVSGSPDSTTDYYASAAREASSGDFGKSKNHMYSFSLLEEDPWPTRAITPANLVWTRGMVEEDKEKTGGRRFKQWEAAMYDPREGYDVMGEFQDAMDEFAYWEGKLLDFVREAPLSQRRSLPYLHEWYRLLVHRTIRAERRYISTRNAAIGGKERKATAAQFKQTEDAVERVRAIYSETHRSLSSPNYDPLRMKKSILAKYLRMSPDELMQWRAADAQQRNQLIADLS